MKLQPTVWLMSALMCVAAIAGASTRPNLEEEPDYLQATVPQAFGPWRKTDDGPLRIDPATDETLSKVYKETLTRTYVDGTGYRIMLSLARSRNQIGVQEAHRPEICYPAQGFDVLGRVQEGTLTTAHGPIEVTRLTARNGTRVEPITYWLTMADRVVRTRWDKRIVQLIAAFTGQTPGGLLFRVSSIDGDTERAFRMHEKFIADMMASVPPEARRKLSGLTATLP